MGKCVAQLKEFDELWSVEKQALDELEDEIHALKELWGDNRDKLREEIKSLVAKHQIDIGNKAIEAVTDRIKAVKVADEVIDLDDADMGKSMSRTSAKVFNFYDKIEATFNSMARRYVDSMFKIKLFKQSKKLKGVNLHKMFRSGSLDKEISAVFHHVGEILGKSTDEQDFNKVMKELTKVIEDADELEGIKISREAKEVAKTIKELSNIQYQDLRSTGVNIGYRLDHFMTRRHDANKILELGNYDVDRSVTAWADMMFTRIDKKKTFIDSLIAPEGADAKTAAKFEAKQREVLENMARRIVESDSKNYFAETDVGTKVFRAMKKSQLHFKSGADEFAYFQEFSPYENFYEGIVRQSEHTAKKYASASVMGSNPDAVMHEVSNKIRKRYTGKVKPGLVQSLKDWDKAEGRLVAGMEKKSGLNKLLKDVRRLHDLNTSSFDSPGHWLDNVARSLRVLSALKLGMAPFSAMFDINNTAMVLAARSGRQALSTHISAFSEFMSTAIETAPFVGRDRLIALADEFELESSFSDYGTVVGSSSSFGFSKGALKTGFSWAMEATFLPWQTIRSKLTNARLQSRLLTDMVDLAVAGKELQKDHLFFMERYGITAEDLKFIGDNAERSDILKGVYTIRSLRDIDLDKFGAGSDMQNIRKQNELVRKWQQFVDTAVHEGTPTPGNRQKMLFNKDSDSAFWRNVADLIFQFKETAVKATHSNYKAMSDIHAIRGTKGTAAQGAQMLVGSLAVYFVSSELRAIASGKESPLDKIQKGDEDAWNAAITDWLSKAGLSAFLADAASTGMNKNFGVDLKDYLAGPGVDIVSDAVKMAGEMTRGKFKKPFKRYIKRHLPAQNYLPYRAAERLWMGYQLRNNDFHIIRD